MKRKIALVLSIVLLCMCFAGCTMENKRKTHLKYDENGNVPLNGHTYIQLDENVDILNPIMDTETVYYLTEPDVPLLLQEIEGASTYVSKDGKFLIAYGMFSVNHYCRSDVYEETVDQINNLKMEYFCYTPVYSETDQAILISLEDSLWLKELVQQIPKQENDGTISDEWEFIGQLDACNEEMYLREHVYNVYQMGLRFYLRSYDHETHNYEIYTIPAEDGPRFYELFADIPNFEV